MINDYSSRHFSLFLPYFSTKVTVAQVVRHFAIFTQDIINDTQSVFDQAKYTRPSDIVVFPVFIQDDVNHSAFLPFQLAEDVVMTNVFASSGKLDLPYLMYYRNSLVKSPPF
jgi:hypothetical protein